MDTVISSITAWRWAPWDTNLAVWHIYIFGVDQFGTPDPQHLIADGPLVQVPYSDGIHHTPFRFVFDPPVVLPGPGEYEFAIQGDQCQGIFDLAANCTDAYPLGRYWLHDRVLFDTCHVRKNPLGDPTHDLAFQIEFCENPVPVAPFSWGRIKATYR